ncbi:E3 ubiquitin-protein ligase Siah1-like [Tenebrio molitor]|uniref:E3 ubiquitin-protein ligase Siah1-like n=1 Tax=Tenebrio molitor TaxID=7067 RepID=UPI0036246A08
MNNLNIELLKALQCSCCFDYMKGVIYICFTGHSVCDTCWNAHNSCLICEYALTDTRNYSLEGVCGLVEYPCENNDKGCPQYLKLEELEEHRQLCDYRSYSCNLDKQCSWEGRRDQLKKHYLDKHDDNVLIGEECTCLWKHDKPGHTVYLMLAFDELFYVHNRSVNDIMYWTVQYIGRSEDVILFYFEIEIFTDQFNDRRLAFSEICHDDVKVEVDEILDSGFCVAVPLAVLETYMNTEGVVFYKIKIRRA